MAGVMLDRLPHRLALRVLADVLLAVLIASGGVFVRAIAQGTVPVPTSPDFPWSVVLQSLGTALVALFTWLVKRQVSQVHLSINSKMDALLELTAKAAHAEGVLEGGRRAAKGDTS